MAGIGDIGEIADPEPGHRQFFMHDPDRNEFNTLDRERLIIDGVDGQLGGTEISGFGENIRELDPMASMTWAVP